MTVYEPEVSLATKPGAAAVPWELVPTVAAYVPVLEKVPLAPVEGAVKVTLVPDWPVVTGQPSLFCSCTDIGAWNGVPTLAVWGVPPVTTSSLGGL